MNQKERSEIIIHPIRLRITALLNQKTHTAGELASKLHNVPPATLYRHIKKLETAGVIRVVDSYPVRGTLEKVYGLKNSSIGEFSLEDMKDFTIEDHERLFTAFTSSLNYSYYDFLTTLEVNPERMGLCGYHSHSVVFNPEDLPDFKNEFIALLEKYKSKAESSIKTEIFQLSTIIIPEVDNESE
ncbi:MAG TPA: hypothetical protein DCO79_02315 [Spirochaeta sp.]|nr:hypothetical protein [Spirochaeta sp.]